MNSVLFDLGFIQIKWYSLFILLAFIIGSILVGFEAHKKGLDKDTIIDLFFYMVLVSILGARVYYILFNLDYYLNMPLEILAIWHGGLAIHGGIIAGFIFTYFYTKKKKINLLILLDILVVSLLIGQAIGRWGNFFNGEAFGRIVSKAILDSMHIPKFIIKGMFINGYYREPTFLYESIASFIGFIIMLIIRKIKNLKVGVLSSFYLIWYGLERFIIESMRSDSLMIFNIKMAQLISIVGIIIGIVLLIKSINSKKLYSKEMLID